MQNTIVLNADYTFLNTVNWQRALCLMVKGKVEVLKTFSFFEIDTQIKKLVILITQLY